MAEAITPFSLLAPGFYGLNTADSPVDTPNNFALVAQNCIIDKSGRLTTRKGWVKSHTVCAELGTADVTCIGEMIALDGTQTILLTGNGGLGYLSSGTVSIVSYGGSGSAPTITDNNWKFCQMNGVGMFWQAGYDPMIYEPLVSTTTTRRLSERSGSTGTIYQCNEAICAYGRVWAAGTTTDKQTIAFSDLNAPHIWTGGTSGTLNVRTIWPDGDDEITALVAHNNLLFVFGRRQILIYAGAEDPATMKLSDTIVGIGCIARDSVQKTGEDVWFLSDTGVRSIARTIQEKSAALSPISKNVSDDLQVVIDAEDADLIKSGFSATNGFYLLTFPTSDVTYCFDTRQRLPDGSAKVTTWTLVPTAFCESRARALYIGMPGYVGTYSRYMDNGVTYTFKYYTPWIDFGNPVQKSILKKVMITLIGGIGQSMTIKWAYDFSDVYFSGTAVIFGTTINAYYSIDEYSSGAEYVGLPTVNILSTQGSSSGRVIQFGFEADSINQQMSVQKVDLFTKDGRL